jgi:3-oxoadipate enol-lactonase
MDALKIRKAHIAGLSYGGCVATKFAVMHPERLTCLSLLATPAKVQESFAQRASSAEHLGMEAQVIPTLLRWFTPEMLAENPWCVRYARERVRRTIVSDWADAWRALAAMDTFSCLPGLRVPTQVVAGDQDASTPPAAMKEAASHIPHAHYSVIHGGTHILALNKPAETASAILHARS